MVMMMMWMRMVATVKMPLQHNYRPFKASPSSVSVWTGPAFAPNRASSGADFSGYYWVLIRMRRMMVVVVAIIMVMLIVNMVMVNWTPLAIAKFSTFPTLIAQYYWGNCHPQDGTLCFKSGSLREKKHFYSTTSRERYIVQKIIFLIRTERQSFYCAILSLNNQNI